MAKNRDKAAKRRAAQRYAKYSKKTQSKTAGKHLAEGDPGSYALGRRRNREEVRPPKGGRSTGRTRVFTIGGPEPEAPRVSDIYETPPIGHATEVQRYAGKGKEILFEGETKDIPEVIEGSEILPGAIRRESQLDAADQIADATEFKTDASRAIDPAAGELEARVREFGIKMPDKLVTTRRKSLKGRGTKVRAKTRYFGDIPEAEFQAAKDREADLLAKGHRASVVVRGDKIIEKKKIKRGTASRRRKRR